MSSSVYFKFKSQKDPQRVTFDGTGISVFELKKEIIDISKLGDGTDFDLLIYNQDTQEEYDDDTAIIPRSTSVTARRLPATKQGQGRAARYVRGSMPVNAKVTRPGQSTQNILSHSKPSKFYSNTSTPDVGQTEQERMRAMLEMGGAEWEREKQNMATASRVPISGFKKQASVPDRPPPDGYRCFRCGLEGHWIQNCPTNDDPNFDGQKKKRVTGIPRSQLKSVSDVPSSTDDGLTDESRQPTSVLVNADGERVVAVPDTASWQQFQEKAQVSAAQKEKAALGSKELQERGLECPIDNRLFVNPVKTPCCGKTYCYDCIDTALADNDLVCPSCSTEQVFLEDLVPDEEMVAKIKAYEDEKKQEKDNAEKAAAEEASNENTHTSNGEAPNDTPKNLEVAESNHSTTEAAKPSRTPTPSNGSGIGKKRAAEEELKDERKPESPAAMQRSNSTNPPDNPISSNPPIKPPSASDVDFAKQMDALMGTQKTDASKTSMPSTSMPQFPMDMGMNMPGMPNMPFPQMQMQPNPYQMQQGFNNGMPFNPVMMNQMPNMAMPQMSGFPQWDMSGSQGMFGPNMPYSNQQYPQQNWQGAGNNMNQRSQFSQQMQQPMYGRNQQFRNNNNGNNNNHSGGSNNASYSNQSFGQATLNDDDAYMRKPVNPHRYHQGKQQKKPRPTDYRELG